MSIDLITMVRQRLDVSGGELLVAVELADASNDKGEGIFVGVARMADRSRQDPRTVQRQLKHLVEVGWLQVVKRGGGRGVPTTYRINPAWVKGDSLPGFPDFTPTHYAEDKGDNLSPFPEEDSVGKGDKSDQKGDKNDRKGDTAMSPDPLTRIPKDARARATPSGSRAASSGKPPNPGEPPPFDERLSRARWWNEAHGTAISMCWLFELCSREVKQLDDLPPYRRETLKPACLELTESAVAEERAHYPLTKSQQAAISDGITRRIQREINILRPAAPAERAAAVA